MPIRQARIRRARHWLANRGLLGFAKEISWRLRLILKGEAIPGRPGPDTGPHPFDLAYNVDTTGLVWGEALSTEPGKHDDAKYWATGYYGVAPSSFEDALKRLSLDWSQLSFIDIGCGKGRALLLALRHPFRQAIGVELSPELALIASANLLSFSAPWRMQATRASVITCDATSYTFPDGPLLLFLYHPFAAPVMERFLNHLAHTLKARPRPIYLLYANPELATLLDRTGFLSRVWDIHFPMSQEDVAADRFSSSYERIIAYRSVS